MLIAMLGFVPWWAAGPAYFLIGTLWACFYLPRCIELQARRYGAWRDELLEGRPLEQVLGPATLLNGEKMHPAYFLKLRGYAAKRFSEQRAIAGFLADIAFWPVRIPQKLVFDYLRVVWVYVWRAVKAAWRTMLLPALRAVWKRVCALVKAFWRWTCKVALSLYDAMIQRANREAMADLKKLKALKGLKGDQ